LHSTVVTDLTASSSSSTASLQSLVLRQQEQQPEQEQYQSSQPCDKLGETAESDLDHAKTISEASKIIKLTAEGEHLKMEDEKLPELDIVNKQEVYRDRLSLNQSELLTDSISDGRYLKRK